MTASEHMQAARYFIKELRFDRARRELTMAAEHLRNADQLGPRRDREIARLERDVAARLEANKEHY